MHEILIKSVTERIKLSAEEVEALKRYFIPKKVRKRQYILNAGDVCQYITFVEKGMLRSFSTDESGQEHVVQFAIEGWWISDLGSFISGDDSVYNIEALEDSEVLNLTKEQLEEMTRKLPCMEHYFRVLMQNNIVALQRRLIATVSLTAEEKYTKLMEVCPDIINRASQQHVASYLGLTPETLSRVRKQVSNRK